MMLVPVMGAGRGKDGSHFHIMLVMLIDAEGKKKKGTGELQQSGN